jgi:hypothetical protein
MVMDCSRLEHISGSIGIVGIYMVANSTLYLPYQDCGLPASRICDDTVTPPTLGIEVLNIERILHITFKSKVSTQRCPVD